MLFSKACANAARSESNDMSMTGALRSFLSPSSANQTAPASIAAVPVAGLAPRLLLPANIVSAREVLRSALDRSEEVCVDVLRALVNSQDRNEPSPESRALALREAEVDEQVKTARAALRKLINEWAPVATKFMGPRREAAERRALTAARELLAAELESYEIDQDLLQVGIQVDQPEWRRSIAAIRDAARDVVASLGDRHGV